MSDSHESVAIVLAGGFGTRIKHLLPDVPKPLAPVAGRPFLEWVVLWLRSQGYRRIVLSTCYLADKIDAFAAALQIPGVSIECVRETVPLGTGGAAVHALTAVPSAAEQVLVCNGDSLVLADLSALRDSLADECVDAAILGVRLDDASRYGTIAIDCESRLVGFEEKRPGRAIINAGVYLFRRRELSSFSAIIPLSFEYDVFATLLSKSRVVRVAVCAAPFIDIGTDASLSEASQFIHQNKKFLT